MKNKYSIVKHPKKILILAVIVHQLCMQNGFTGFGPIADEQPELLKQCESWKPGDTIPEYLLKDAEDFNPMSMFKPTDYIMEIDNKELLFHLIIHSQSPHYNRAIAFNRFLNILGLSEFKSFLDNIAVEPELDNIQLNELRKIFSSKCVKVYWFFVDFDDMPKDDAFKVLSHMKSKIDAGEDMMEVYKIYAKKYEYLKDTEFPKHYVTKIGNGGKFYLSQAIMNTFPAYFSREKSKDHYKKILGLNKGDSIIVEELITDKDKELREKHGDIIYTETSDRLILYIVTEIFEDK